MLTAKNRPGTSEISLPNVGERPGLIKPDGCVAKPLGTMVVEGLVTVTPELAWRIIQEAPYAKQRPIRRKHVEALAMQMRKREWTGGTQIHFGRLPDGTLALVNGNHRMHAVIKAETPVVFQMLITDTNLPGLDALYRRHDRLAATRTITDTLTAEGIPEAHGLPRTLASACFRAIPLIESGFRHIRSAADPYLMRSDEARLRAAEPWWPIAAILDEAISQKPPSYLLKAAGTVAVALVTMRYQEAKAFAFWQGVANNDRLGRADPRATYVRTLYQPKPRTEVDTAKVAATAWNAFYTDRELEIIRVQSGPIRILGTPYEKLLKA